MKAKDIMTRNIISRDINTSIFEISKTMQKENIGFIPIHKEHKIIGVLTDRDIVTRIIANQDLNHIEAYLHTHLITAKEEDSTEIILEQMKKYKVKRVLITKKNKMVGVVSISDIIKHINDSKQIIDALQIIFQIKENKEGISAEIDEFYL